MISNQNQKRFIITFLIIFLFTFNLGVFVPTKQAKAQPVTVVADAPGTVQWITDTIRWFKDNIFEKMLASAFLRATNTFVKNLAYKAAEDLATGISGGKPRWYTQNWGDYLKDAGDAAAAEFLDQMAAGVGLDICEPPSGINLKLKIGINIDTQDVPKPRCSLNDIHERWEEFGENLKNDPLSMVKLNDQSLKKLGFGTDASSEEIRAKLLQSMISVKESDIGYIDYVSKAVNAKQTLAEANAELERLKQDGAKAVTTPITNAVTEPGQTAEEAVSEVVNSTKDSANFTTGEFWVDTANIFFNTLVSKTMSGLIKKIMKVDPPHYEKATEDRGTYATSNQKTRITALEKTFTSIERIAFNTKLTDLDVITEMEMNLGGDISGKMNNNTIDSDFAEALRKAQGGETLILKEAVEQNLIDENKWFGYIDVASQDPKEPSVEDGYSTNNIKKLVKNRVVPVGWQFAAGIIKREKGQITGCSAQGCTLKNVMDHFDKSGTYKEDKDGDGEDEIYKDEYCGWRPISAEPYFMDIDNEGGCELDGDGRINGIAEVEVKWVGYDNNTPGICYKYEANEDGVIDNVSQVAGNKEDCESFDPDENGYYEWEPGGCMIKEKDESPLCHLVDPNTVLSAPNQQCGANGYYSILESRESSNRQEDCADVKHCIQEDDQGKCVGGYDYCLKEENIWRFNGDSCSKQFSSCQTLKDDEGEENSYLINTLKDCPQEEVGCRDYVIEKERNNGEYVWDNEADRIYFNHNIEECNENDQGCSEFIQIEPGTNLIPNGSFEINEDFDIDMPDGWIGINFISSEDSYTGNYSIQHTDSGTNSLFMSYYDLGSGVEKNIFYVPPQGLYTLSYYAKGSGTTITPKIRIYFKDGNYTNEYDITDAIFTGNNNWERKSGYFSVINPNNKEVDYVALRFSIEGEAYLDGVQFELNKFIESDVLTGEGDPSRYKDYGEGSKEYFKKAPDYLNCQEYSLNSYNCAEEYHPCCDYVKYCPAEDLNCAPYYPVNNDPFVPAVLQNEDYCVAECNNYQTLSQNPSYFDQLEDPDTTVVDQNFIPETAKDCDEPSCELFTNIDDLERGAESKEYYSFVRQCVKPNDTGVTTELYYTWEGSDTSAFQLKTWKLLKSNENDIFNPDENSVIQGGKAPCTNVEIGTSTCIDDSSNNVEECNPLTNLDCRTFYDKDAIPHNRLLSKTIPITEECINLRRELSNQLYKVAPSMSQTCEESNVGCLTYKGNYSNNVRNIFREDFEDGSIRGWMADAVDGSGNILNGNINARPASEAIQYNGNSMKVWVDGSDATSIWISYNLTEAGVDVIPGKQYSLSFWAKSFADDSSGLTNPANSYMNTSPINPVNALNNLFYKKALAAADDAFLTFDNDLRVLHDEWLLYNYNITDFETSQTGDVILSFEININNYLTPLYDGIYIDNIILKGFTNSFDKIRDSWETPQICLTKNYLGCQEYKDSSNNSLYLYQFTDLCPEENIGCTAMIDTQNSSMAWRQTFNAYCKNDAGEDDCDIGNYYYKNYSDIESENISSSTVQILEDELVYLVQDNKFSCTAFNKGCQEMSVINNEGQNDSLYLVNNPDYYVPHDFYGRNESILCLEDYKNCVSFTTTQDSKIFKIHPRNLTCDYREADPQMNIEAGFYTEEGENCTHLLYNKDYETFVSSLSENWKPYDALDNEYAALCSPEEDQCTGFIDPLDNLDLSDYVYNQVGINVDYNHPSQWRQASWARDGLGNVLGKINNFNSGGGISYHPASEDDPYDGINVVMDGGRDLLIYQGPDENKEAFFFNVKSDSIYRLSARVKLKDVDSVMTFLTCRRSTSVNGSGNSTEIDNYFVDESWYESSDNIPYALPSINSNYTTSDTEDWQYIYGLYKILPGAQYCNLTFYINGQDEDHLTLADINLEKVEGDYYYLDNENINYQDCNSANLKDGCVLFYDTTQSGVKWNHEMSYDENRLAPGDSHLPSDTNALLKVERDKQCAEWLTCGAQLKTIDPSTNQQKDACVSLIACDELSEKSGVCAHPFNSGKNAKPLTLDYYHQMRGKAGWSDLDYSGYSVPGLYPIDSLVPVEMVDDNGVTSTVLTHLVVKQNSNNQPYTYKTGIGVKNSLNSVYSDSPLGTNWASNLTSGIGFSDKSCRLYPEKDSPFPWLENTDIITDSEDKSGYIDIKTKSANFANANICQAGTDEDALEGDCECHYTKANYGSETLYFPYDYTTDDMPPEIDISYTGVEGSNILKRRSTTKYLGWKGFCLDKDQSLFINNTESLTEDLQDYRCLTWYPVDILSGEIDAYAASEEAEVSSIANIGDTDKLCMVGEDWVTPENRVYCGKFQDAHCNVLLYIPEGTKVNLDAIDTEEKEELLFGNDFGNTWLEEGIGSSNFVYESSPDDIGRDIIRKPGDEDGAPTDYYTEDPDNTDNYDDEWTMMDFGGLEGNDYMQILTEIFDADGDVLKFYYDEDVDETGSNNTSDENEWTIAGDFPFGTWWLDRINIYVDLGPGKTNKYGGGHCESCDWGGVALCSDRPIDGINQHEVRADCDRSSTNCGVHKWRNRHRWCNPRPYNYYINISPSDTIMAYEGQCGENCVFDDVSDETRNNGRGCLRNSNINTYYYQVLDLFNGVFDVNECKTTTTPMSITDNDCDFINCMESISGSDSIDHSCSNYNSCFENYLTDSDGNYIVSNSMELAYTNCFTDQVNPGPQYGIYDAQSFCSPVPDDGDGDPDTGLCDVCGNDPNNPAAGCPAECTDCIVNASCTAEAVAGSYDPFEGTTNCDPDCAKTCKTYVSLDNVIYDSNNFYLNWLTPADISSDDNQVCEINGEEICGQTLSGTTDNYGEEVDIRFNHIYENSNWVDIYSPFSVNVVSGNPARNIIYADSRPGTNEVFNDYYSDLSVGESITTAQNRIGNVIKRIPNENFHEYDGSPNWPQPDWTGIYWNETYTLEPIIRQTAYDENDGFSEGNSGISINSTHEEDILGLDGDLYAYLMFYAYTATGTTPIQEIVIDWTGVNADKLVLQGPFKNHKHDCVRRCGEDYYYAFVDGAGPECTSDADCSGDKCYAWTWGNHANACVEDDPNKNQDGYFSYSYVYTCDALSDYWQDDCAQYSIEGGCCVYTPSVKITDSWGNSKTEDLGTCGSHTCSVIVVPK